MKSVVLLTNILTPYRISFFDELEVELRRQGVEFHVLVMSETEENRNWKYDEYKRNFTKLLSGKRIKIGGFTLNCNLGLSHILDELSPDFIIAAGSYIHPSLWRLLFSAHKRDIPVFFWSESHLNTVRQYSNIKIAIREMVRKCVYKQFDGFFFAGELSREFVEKYAHSQAHLIFLPNLIDNDFYSQRVMDEQRKKDYLKALGIEMNQKLFLIPARLSTDKGIIPFLESLVRTDITERYTILIVGDGDKKEDIESFIKKNKLPVLLLGYKCQEEVRKLYQVVDGFILPSIVDPNPLTCIEALWSELPMLVSDHVGNYPEVINPGVNGYVFSYSNNAEQIIMRFIEMDSEWQQNASSESKRIAQTKYETHKQVKRIVDEITEYVEGKTKE